MKQDIFLPKILYNLVIIINLLFILPGCSRYINLAKKTFYQADTVNINVDQSRKYIRSAKIYDQFTTIGMFDAILFNDKVEETYNKLKSDRTGDYNNLNLKQKNSLEDNKNILTFYLLLPPNNIKDVIITYFDGNISWSIFLEINSEKILPLTLEKLPEIDPEFTYIFGPAANRFREFYKITFNVKNNLINFKNIKLCLRSTRYRFDLNWLLSAADWTCKY